MTMKKIETSEATGAALEWLVAKCENLSPRILLKPGHKPALVWLSDYSTAQFTTNWAQGGPIIERELGNLYRRANATPLEPEVWTGIAYRRTPDYTVAVHQDGPTPLIAAMRCYVASKLGEEVEVPEEFL